MAEIHVVFPRQGGVVIAGDPQAVIGGEFISWNIHSLNPAVRRVQIRFDRGDASFFVSDSSLEKSVAYTEGEGQGQALIWGLAPRFVNDRRDDKYTVEGLDEDGKPIEGATLDPVIITDRPPIIPGGM
jgi:hypothetical protein